MSLSSRLTLTRIVSFSRAGALLFAAPPFSWASPPPAGAFAGAGAALSALHRGLIHRIDLAIQCGEVA